MDEKESSGMQEEMMTVLVVEPMKASDRPCCEYIWNVWRKGIGEDHAQ